MRLNKYIAKSGIASRRKADEMIAAGRVSINGVEFTELGYDVKEHDVVEVDGQIVKEESSKVYIVLNKPKGFITSVKDERGRPTVMDLISDIDERIYPVGRLDSDTTGMLIMTNDGDFAYALTHPSHELYKKYRAKVAGTMTKESLAKLRKGVDIDGYTTAPAIVELIKQTPKNAIVEISIHEGKNRQVRKMFASVGNKVLDLERKAIGDVYLGNLMLGHYRKLTKEEQCKILENS